MVTVKSGRKVVVFKVGGNAPKDYTALCQVFLPRPLHSAADHIRTLARHFNVEPGVLL